MKKKFISIISLILVANVLNTFAQERRSRFVPGPEPDRVILTIKSNPATSMAVTWRTDTTISESTAQLSENLPSIFLSDSSVTFRGNFNDIEGDGIIARYHSVEFTNLKPETSYTYRVGSGDHKSEWFRFETAASVPKPFSFIYLGDSQVYDNYLFSRLIRQVYRSTPEAAFVIYTGDLVDGGDGKTMQDEEWGEWHSAGSFINGEIPVVPTTGNHEYVVPGNREVRELNRYWKPGFTLPENGPKGMEETVYYIDYQGVRIISLNSYELSRNEESAIKQSEWLEGILKDSPCKWNVLIFHHPLFSTAKTRDNKTVREYIKPLIDKYNVDLVLSGHDHTYARAILPPEGTGSKVKNAGSVYVVSVSGAKQYKQDAEKWWDVGRTYIQAYQVITVNNGILDYRAYDVSGELFDHFTLKKKEDGSKQLIKKSSSK